MRTTRSFPVRSKMRSGSCHLLVAFLLFCMETLVDISIADAALDSEEESALEILRAAINLPSWTGDPCNTTWLNCSKGSTLQNVLAVNLSHRNLSGAIPPDIRKFRKISDIDLNRNKLNGSIPDISNMTSLTNINIRSNLLEGPLPSLGALLNLEQFDGSQNGFVGPFPDIKNLDKLIGLSVAHNFLTGPIPPSVFQNPRLQWLFMSNNSLAPAPIPDMSQLTGLMTLNARLCNFQGAIPSMENNRLLKDLSLQLNNLTSIPSDLRNLTWLSSVIVHSNIISGNLPDLPPATTQQFFKLKQIDFSNNSFSGEIPQSWADLSFLEEMKLGENRLVGVIPKEIGNLRSLLTLNLSFNLFSGPIPDEISFLPNLQTLDLRNNQFTGIVPERLVNLSKLQTLYLDNNNFTGIPVALAKKEGLNITFGDLKIIFGNESAYNRTHGELSSNGKVGLVVGVVCAGILLLAIIALLIRRRRKYNNHLSREDMPKSAQSFSLKKIKAMTQNFKTLIGRGGFGPVYHGKLPSGKEVAVKVRAMDSKQGAKEFLNEVRLLSRLHHRNLVPLIGYCLDAQEQILVYTYMSEGTLHDHLHRLSVPGSSSTQKETFESSSKAPLDWKTRIDIAINSARGLEYLHKDCNPPVIHRDVKTSNILLTDKLEAKFGDLGISKQTHEPDTEEEFNMTGGVTTAIKGTFGYLDPEYFTRQRLTTKSDVYGFGIILLEIITAKRAQCLKFPDSEETSLKEWVEAALAENKLESVVDPVLKGGYEKEGMLIVLNTALSCLLPTGAQRPEMGEIVQNLNEALQIEKKLHHESAETPDVIVTLPQSSDQLSIPYNPESPQFSSSGDFVSHPSWNTNPR